MTFPLEYHKTVNRRSIPALPALFGMLLFLFLVVSTSPAQINSATSAGSAHSGGFAPPTGSVAPPTGVVAPHTGSVAPPTGGFTAHNGIVPAVTDSAHFPHSTGSSHHGNGNHHPHHNTNGYANGAAYYPYFYPYAVPYPADATDAAASNDEDDDDADYQGGPTIFDRRGSGQASYIPPSSDGPAYSADNAFAAQSAAGFAPESPQPLTTLVFKDGHQVEVSNYAIVSQTLYDLTPGHRRKIALADLDIPATQKQNDDRGVVFQLPSSAQAN